MVMIVAPLATTGPAITGDANMSEVQMILQRVETLDAEFARRMKKEPTKVTRVPAGFFKKGTIYHIAVNGRYGPVMMTLGIAEPDYSVSLSNNPDGFFELAKRAGTQLDAPQLRDAYVRVFLDTTKNLAKRTQFLDKFPDLRQTDTTTPQDLERYHALKEKYGKTIRPLHLSEDEPWTGKAYALVIWDLVEYDVTLQEDGKIEVKTNVLEKTMPICLQLTPLPETRPTSAPAPAVLRR
jgi:hypothetical protein